MSAPGRVVNRILCGLMLAVRMIVAVMLGAGVGIGCAAHRTGDAVRTLHFEGNSRPPAPSEWLTAEQTDRALRNAMTHPKGRWQSFLFPSVVEPAWLDPVMLDRDGWRLEMWYANHGYFDARFLGWEIDRPKRPASRRARPVDITGHVEQGEPSRIAAIDLTGIEKLGTPMGKRIRSTLKVEKGAIWSTDDWNDSIAGITLLLRQQSLAYADVKGTVQVDPVAHEVKVAIRVDAGPACRFGKVSIEGLSRIKAEELAPLIEVIEGRPYRESSLQHTREKLFALGVFGVVNVLPVLSDRSNRVVPIQIKLTEIKTHEIKAGPGFQFEPGLQTLGVSATYTDNNFANRLWRISQTATLGVASTSTAIDSISSTQLSPVGSIRGNVDLPRLFESRFSILNQGSFGRDVTAYSDVLRAEFAPSVLFEGIPHLSPTIGYHIRYEDQVGDHCTLKRNNLGAASEYPYLLSMLEQGAVYDGRNDPLAPTRGWYWSLKFAEAGGPFGGLYDFFKAQGEVRVYRSILRLGRQDFGTTVAARLGGGIIQPYGSTTRVPLEERLFLGGGTTVRGWAADHLGPHVESSSADGCDTGIVPVGGNLQLYGNLELRQPLPFYPELSLATFVDAGRVWDEPANFAFSAIQYSVGGGLRYLTSIGPIRLDVAWRLGDPSYFGSGVDASTGLPVGSAEPRWAMHFGLSEAF